MSQKQLADKGKRDNNREERRSEKENRIFKQATGKGIAQQNYYDK